MQGAPQDRIESALATTCASLRPEHRKMDAKGYASSAVIHLPCHAEVFMASSLSNSPLGRTPRGSCNRLLLRRVLGRFIPPVRVFRKDKVLRRVLRRERSIESA